jgi:hypothetical protein
VVGRWKEIEYALFAVWFVGLMAYALGWVDYSSLIELIILGSCGALGWWGLMQVMDHETEIGARASAEVLKCGVPSDDYAGKHYDSSFVSGSVLNGSVLNATAARGTLVFYGAGFDQHGTMNFINGPPPQGETQKDDTGHATTGHAYFTEYNESTVVACAFCGTKRGFVDGRCRSCGAEQA